MKDQELISIFDYWLGGGGTSKPGVGHQPLSLIRVKQSQRYKKQVQYNTAIPEHLLRQMKKYSYDPNTDIFIYIIYTGSMICKICIVSKLVSYECFQKGKAEEPEKIQR